MTAYFRRRAPLRRRILTPRERHAIDYITACGWEARAFSVSFSVTRSCVKGLIYYDKNEMRRTELGGEIILILEPPPA